MSILEMKVDALVRIFTAEDDKAKDAAIEELRSLVASKTALPAQGEGDRFPGLEAKVAYILRDLGCPASVKGYDYLREALVLVARNPGYIKSITKGLYTAVGEKFGVSHTVVERRIRVAIETTWSRGDLAVLQLYFGNTVHPSKGKPTNGEFIAQISDQIRLAHAWKVN